MNMLWVAPVMPDYESARATFSWRHEFSRLAGLPGGGVNIGYEAVDRHLGEGHGERVALRCVGRDGQVRAVTYARLAADSSRFAHVLESLGVGRGERVFTLLGRRPELYATVLGALRARRVVCPLFTAFGPEPVALRMELGGARALVTTRELYERKVAPVRSRLPHLRHVLLLDPGDDPPPDTLSLLALTDAAPDAYTVGPTAPEDLALLHFTSGTTGTPKGAMHAHEAVLAHRATAARALDLHEGDVFWCTADPGWVTGMSYGIIAPLTLGVTTVVDEGDFAPGRWYDILAGQHVTVWYTAPTALRMLMRAAPRDGTPPSARHDLSSLRFVASVGEPLNPEAVHWGREALGLPVHDTWWQTETGAIMIAGFAADPVRPGSMGRPVPGVEAAVLACGEDGRAAVDDAGHVRVLTEPGTQGELALRAGWPSMFRGYLHEPRLYEECFADDWYLTGDLVSRDADGWFWFVGRADDVIKSAGHLIGPFEVESALMEHPAVAEAGVIGRPDPLVGAIVKAFVLLRPEYPAGDELRRDLVAFARRRLGPAVAPREIEFVDDLPHTRSGKVMRRLLRARELGLPEGDVSTLETPETPGTPETPETAGTAGAPGLSGKEP
ncbi:acetate--CoA ligase [Streptomyces sp. NPDC048623]|uniref:acetate--CoA ligase n=1 Tax=Streptomyces sp. NPDC048623 TaxID=3155761 RepID=UPI003416FBF6